MQNDSVQSFHSLITVPLIGIITDLHVGDGKNPQKPETRIQEVLVVPLETELITLLYWSKAQKVMPAGVHMKCTITMNKNTRLLLENIWHDAFERMKDIFQGVVMEIAHVCVSGNLVPVYWFVNMEDSVEKW